MKTEFFSKAVFYLLIPPFTLATSQLSADLSPVRELRLLTQQHQITGEPLGDMDIPEISSPQARLGKQLFFSPDLSLTGHTSCATCHHPLLAGADGLPLAVGEAVDDPALIGTKRLNTLIKSDPDHYVNQLVVRHSPSVFNSVLYRKNLFWDGRVQYQLDNEQVSGKRIKVGGGFSGLPDFNYQAESLLQAQARLPMVSPFEMKGLSDSSHNNVEIHQLIIDRLKSNQQWCQLFKQAVGASGQPFKCQNDITINEVTQALAEFQASMTFTDNRFFRFIKGKESLTDSEISGALLFFKSLASGGAGCINCHSGNHFSNERFYNLGIKPFGPGANGRGLDYGRSNISSEEELYAFKTPGLLNTSLTAPYFHNGTVDSLKDVIRRHTMKGLQNSLSKTDPVFNIDSLKRISENIYSSTLKSPTRKLLPEQLTETQISNIERFLQSLTDPCAASKDCLEPFIERFPIKTRASKNELQVSVDRPVSDIPAGAVFSNENATRPDYTACSSINAAEGQETPSEGFSNISHKVGITHQRKVGLIKPGWIMDVINWGGVSALDLNNDCLDDLIFADNDGQILIYFQQRNGRFVQEIKLIPETSLEGVITPLVADIDGDYKADLFLGNDGRYFPQIIFDFLHKPAPLVLSTISGPALNAGFGDLEGDGDLDMVMAFWRTYKSARQPQIWLNKGKRQLKPGMAEIPRLRKSYGDITLNDGLIHQKNKLSGLARNDFTFTPNVADVNQDGRSDVFMTADFFTTQLWKNTGKRLIDVTDVKEIYGSFGMGAAIADFDNDGDLDWFESSIFSRSKSSQFTGNRLYESLGEFRFKNITPGSGISNGGWGWGSCAADFNNDGLLDIFHTTGYGNTPDTATYPDDEYRKLALKVLNNHREFQSLTPRLFINQGGMKFKEQASESGFTEAIDGRGVSCFDYQQDGDIDVLISPWEGTPALYVNNASRKNNWLSIKLVGLPGNTEALGAKLYLYTANGQQYREVRFENNFVSANPRQQHFGLGDITDVEKLIVKWPSPNNEITELLRPKSRTLHLIYHPAIVRQEGPAKTAMAQ